LAKKGTVVGAIIHKILRAIIYEGDAIYYYNKTLNEVERIIASAKLAES
jgi:hypothetical protein